MSCFSNFQAGTSPGQATPQYKIATEAEICVLLSCAPVVLTGLYLFLLFGTKLPRHIDASKNH